MPRTIKPAPPIRADPPPPPPAPTVDLIMSDVDDDSTPVTKKKPTRRSGRIAESEDEGLGGGSQMGQVDLGEDANQPQQQTVTITTAAATTKPTDNDDTHMADAPTIDDDQQSTMTDQSSVMIVEKDDLRSSKKKPASSSIFNAPAAAAVVAPSSSIDLSSPPSSPIATANSGRKRLRRLADSSADEKETETPPASARKRRSRPKEDEDEEYEEEKGEHNDDMDDEEGNDVPPTSPRTRYGFRHASNRSGTKLAPVELTALQRLKAEREDRERALSGTRNKRPRSRFSLESSRDSSPPPQKSKYARVEANISADLDESDEDVVEAANAKYFDSARGSYDAEAEAKELKKTEKEAERKRRQEAAQAQQKREEAFQRWQERERKRKSGKTGKGGHQAAKPRKNKENEDEYDEDDGFVVPDDFDEEEGDDEGFSHQRFDEERFALEEEKSDALPFMDATMHPREAFNVWARYLCGATIDAGYSYLVERTPRLRTRFYAAMKIIEEQFVMRMNTWVKSQTWSRKDAAEVSILMDSLGYQKSILLQEDGKGCEICVPKKGFAHSASHSLSYFGVSYNVNELKHPFKPSDILQSEKYEQHAFQVGSLCHQRLKLYHVMKHFKLHVMLSLKARMKKHCLSLYRTDKPRTKQEAFKVLYYMFDHDTRAIERQFDIWESLNAAADAYSQNDSRKAAVDLNSLEQMQDFDTEECLLDLFNWRDIGKNDKFEITPFILEQEDRQNAALHPATTSTKSRPLKQSQRGGQQADDDEYEIDPEAEEEAEEAERQAEQAERLAKEGILNDDQSEVTAEDRELVLLSSTRRPIQQQLSFKPTATASIPAESITNNSGGWRRRANASSSSAASAAPPSSAESIQDADSDDGSGSSHGQTSGGGWRTKTIRKSTLPLSMTNASSPPKTNLTQPTAKVSTPPASASKSSHPSSVSNLDGDGVYELFAQLSDEEKSNFFSVVGHQIQPTQIRTFIRSLGEVQRAVVKECIQEMEE